MNSHGSAAPATAELSDVGQRARRRIAYRLLPFVFLLYIVNYIDRVNVSFANLRMSADLGFSDRVYGLGVGMFYITYVLFEIPGRHHRRALERKKVDCPNHDLVGNRYDSDWLCAHGDTVLCRPLLFGSCGIELFPRHDRLFDPLVLRARPQPGHRLPICGESRRFFDRLAGGGLAARGTLACARRLALAFYSGGDSCGRHRDHHDLLYDGPAGAGGLASSARTGLAREGITRGDRKRKRGFAITPSCKLSATCEFYD